VAEKDHLFLGFNDIVEPREGLTPPGEIHVRSVFAFADTWDRAQPMIVHCYAGISRSTAGAYMTSLYLNPDQDEMALAQELRRRSPSATPNIRLISIADDILGRKGAWWMRSSRSGAAPTLSKVCRLFCRLTDRADVRPLLHHRHAGGRRRVLCRR
jgi:predicted protein tyrosine phosphatase